MIVELCVLFGVFLTAAAIRIPIFLSVLVAIITYALLFSRLTGLSAAHSMISGLDRPVITAIPYYFLLGAIMSGGGMATRLLRFARSLLGWCRGGLAQVNIGASMLFGGISGSAVADASAIGSLIIPAMKDDGYPASYASAVTATSASVGLLIPPSLPMVLFGIFNDASIGLLFLAGLVPGVLMGLLLITASWMVARKRDYGATNQFLLKDCVAAARESFWVLLLPVMITFTLTQGVATATEVGAVAVLYAVVVSVFIYRDLSLRQLLTVIADSATDSARILSIIAVSGALLWSIANLDAARLLTESLTQVHVSPSGMLWLISALLIAAGTILGPGLLLILFVPSITPVALVSGIDLFHFGVVAILSSSISMLTPPVGILLFITAAQSGAAMIEILREMVPFYLALIALLALIIHVPFLSVGLMGFLN
jgi:tripartite ATP-independent transporter DctM subunit